MAQHRAWMPFYIGDYKRDTGHLSAEQHGAYLLLIMHYWANGSLPTDENQLMRIACLEHCAWHASRNVLAAFFDGNWKHKRIEKELKKSAEVAVSKKQKAKSAAQARWSKRTSGNASSNASSMPEPMLQAMPHDAIPQSHIYSSFGSSSEQTTKPKEPTQPSGGELATALLGSALRSPPDTVPNPPLIISEELVAHEKRKQPRH